jgi:hypothetical protein
MPVDTPISETGPDAGPEGRFWCGRQLALRHRVIDPSLRPATVIPLPRVPRSPVVRRRSLPPPPAPPAARYTSAGARDRIAQLERRAAHRHDRLFLRRRVTPGQELGVFGVKRRRENDALVNRARRTT